jgi:hypothetical protein
LRLCAGGGHGSMEGTGAQAARGGTSAGPLGFRPRILLWTQLPGRFHHRAGRWQYLLDPGCLCSPQTSPLSHLSPALRKESVTSSSAKGNLSHVQGRSKREDLRWDSVSLLVSLAIHWEPCAPLCPSCSEARIRALTVKMGVTGRWHVKGKPSV